MNLKQLDTISINFIIGHGRSGTTLLLHILNEHPNCIASPEIKHIIYFYKKYNTVKIVSPQLINDLKQYLLLLKQNKRFLLSDPLSYSYLDDLKIGEAITYSQVSKLFYLCLMEGKTSVSEINCIIDKNPYYTFYIDTLTTLFPEARFIATIRDYRAYILSNVQKQSPMQKTLSVFFYGFAWNSYLKRITAATKKHPSKIKIIKYEDFALEKETTVKEITHFFGITYSDHLFNFYKTVEQRVMSKKKVIANFDYALRKIKDLSLPVNTSRLDAWKLQLSAHDIKKADYCCSETGNRFGYMPVSKISRSAAFLFSLYSLPGRLRVALFDTFDTPAINFLIYRIQIREKKKLTVNG